ncbi:hypothetical protein VTK56DRAFT_3646 [Thermocarpiscus australiensis]
MYSKLALVASLLASVEARFGQEGAVQNNISALGNFGQPGQAATLAGASPGVLLAGANACAKLELADQIVTTLGNDPKVIAAAKALVAAEKNFNPFAVSIPSLCSDVNLPATPELRGIVPLVDPAVGGSDVENANSAASVDNPFNADGLSVADVATANGFSNFTLQGSDGSTSAAPAGGDAGNGNENGTGNGNASNGNAGNGNSGNGNAGNGNAGNGNGNAGNAGNAATTSAVANCGAVRTLTTVVIAPTAGNGNNAGSGGNNNAGNNNNNNNNSGNGNNNVQKSTIAGLDFGLCVPTMKFVGGLGGRPATEFTFQAVDDKIAAIQQEALNPNIITNRICDELTNQCQANQAAKDACGQARAAIQALGTRDASTAERWNEMLGFAGTDVSQ